MLRKVMFYSFFVYGLSLFIGVTATHANEVNPADIAEANGTKEYTDYGISIEEAVSIQKSAEAAPITSLYAGKPGYVPVEQIKIVPPVNIFKYKIPVYEAPSATSDIIYEFIRGVPVTVVGVVEGDIYAGNATWYKIAYRKDIFYIHATDLFVAVAELRNDVNVYAGPGDKHVYGKMNAGNRIVFSHVTDDFLQFNYDVYWRMPRVKHIERYIDPDDDRNSKYQHIRLDTLADVTVAELNSVLADKGILSNHGDSFREAAKEHGINEAYLIAHAFLETGNGTSDLASGVQVGMTLPESDDGDATGAGVEGGAGSGVDEADVEGGAESGVDEADVQTDEEFNVEDGSDVAPTDDAPASGEGSTESETSPEADERLEGELVLVTEENKAELTNIKTVYNMFGIGAADSCPLECGAKTAYENEWFSVETAIIDGARWIGAGYIYNEYEQNTLYKMKWNPQMATGSEWKQYATDIGWAEKQTKQIAEIYDNFSNATYHFDFPLYQD